MKESGQKIKVVFLGRFPDTTRVSGPENNAELIYLEHIKKNHGTFIEYFFDGRKHSLIKKLFGEKSRETKGVVIHTCGLFKLYRKLKSIRPEIIHIITFERFALTAFIFRIFNQVRIIYSCHGVIAHENKIKKLPWLYRVKDKIAEKIFIEKSDRILAVSEAALNLLSDFYKLKDTSCAIIANPVNEIFANNIHNRNHDCINAVIIFKNIFGLSGIEFLQDFLNRWDKPLNIYVLTDSDVKLHTRPAIKLFRCSLLNREALAEFYKDKHIFFSLNRYETFSIATAEAMVSGLIPIVIDTTGISRFIENGLNGYIVKYGDTERFLNIMLQISAMSKQDRINISFKAADIINELKPEIIYSNYLELYKEVLS